MKYLIYPHIYIIYIYIYINICIVTYVMRDTCNVYIYMMHIYDAYNTLCKITTQIDHTRQSNAINHTPKYTFLWCLDHQPRNARFTAGFPTCAVPLKFSGDCTSCCFTLSTQSCVQQKNKTEASSEVDGHYEWCIRKWLYEVDITPYANHGAGIFSYKLTGS